MPLDKNRLWAKSKRDDEPEHRSMLLPGHLADVYHAAGRVLDATADDQLRALGLDPSAYGGRFRRCVLLAAAVHDLGKANDHFQGMLLGTRDVRQNPQGLRHEWVTVLILQQLRDWLLPAVGGSEADFAVVEWAVAGHHPAFDHPSPPKEPPKDGGDVADLTTRAGHPDFTAALEWIGTEFGLGAPPTLANERRDVRELHENDLNEWSRVARRQWVKQQADAKLVAAVKNCLVAADIAGSALRDAAPDLITRAFESRPAPGDLDEVVTFRLGNKQPRAFQTAVAESAARVTYVKAGCGSGKTVAAYMWAARNHPERRLYVCYPTTGTATEGFRDYLFDEAEHTPRVGADLFHGRAGVDFDLILGTGPDRRPDEDAARLDALRAWQTPVVACTVDAVLGLVQNNRRGLLGWPALSQAAFVFDEIHAYDDALFAALLRFLRDLPGLPALLMTASLPAAREEALRQLLDGLTPIAGPEKMETRPRYKKVDAGNDPWPLVVRTLADGGKVLWVCNTVGRVMAAADADPRALVYHSRFKYEDRVRQHADVIGAFKAGGPALAVCSQVAEMSLDLSADLLVTDLAPVPALIQRLGRLNRRAEDGHPTKPFVVVEPDGPRPHLPYTPDDLSAARDGLGRLPADGISQRHLADAWEQRGGEVPVPGGSTWLDGGPETRVKELRAGSPGITVLMACDVPRVKARPRDLPRVALPMPPCRGWEGWTRVRGLPVAPPDAILYHPERGAEWRR